MPANVGSNLEQPRPGDVALSFLSFSDIDASFDCDLYNDPALATPFQVVRYILSLASLIEALVTQNRVTIFAAPLCDWPSRPEFSFFGEPIVQVLSIDRAFPEYVRALRENSEAEAAALEAIAAHAVRFLDHNDQQDHLKIKDPHDAQGVILLGDMLRSQDAGVNFYPTPLESAMCLTRIAVQRVAQANTARAAVRLIEAARQPLAADVNSALQGSLFDVYVPCVFSAALRESKDILDLFRVAAQMRETREARAFREWVAAVDNDSSLLKLHKELAAVQDLADSLARGIDASKRTIDLRLGISMVGTLQVTIPLSFRRRRARHLTFLASLFQAASRIVGLDGELRRALRLNRPEAKQLLASFVAGKGASANSGAAPGG